MIDKLLTSIYYRLPFLAKWRLSGKGFIFMLHRVLPAEFNTKHQWNKGLAITPEGLERWVIYFRNLGFDLVSMDEAHRRKNSKNSKPFIALTMDDGYKDNLTYGLPLLERLQVPCTIYVSNCFPNNTAVYWWYFLEEYLSANSAINLNAIGIDYQKKFSEGDRKLVYDEVRELLRKSSYKTHLAFAHDICGIKNLESLNTELNLTWSEVQTLDENPLITIGGHTQHHVSLKNQTPEDIEFEISQGTTELNKHLKASTRHFAYPYGSLDDVSTDLFAHLQSVGYQTAVLNHPGSIFNGSETDFQIPRMGLSDDTNEARILDLLSGRLHLNFNGLRRIMMNA